MKRLVAVTVVAILAGCISAEERAARDAARAEQMQAEQEARNKAYTESLTSQCAAIGYQRGSDGMRQCVLQLHTSTQANNTQMRAVIMQQLLQQQQQQEYRSLPFCSRIAPGLRGYMQAQGTCR